MQSSMYFFISLNSSGKSTIIQSTFTSWMYGFTSGSSSVLISISSIFKLVQTSVIFSKSEPGEAVNVWDFVMVNVGGLVVREEIKKIYIYFFKKKLII